MQVVIRADASLKMGTGHIMRCLTLAQALQEKGAVVDFICREHLGHLIEFIETKGFIVHRIPLHEQGLITEQSDVPSINSASTQQHCSKATRPGQPVIDTLFHSSWLGSTQYQDAQDCMNVLRVLNPDWLIVDHYALDETWQVLLEVHYHKLMVIDDLGDRQHICDLLLDQNHGSTVGKYQNLVPKHCQILAGSHYALLRPEFAQWREVSLKRRQRNGAIQAILVTLGGVDPDNYTELVLQKLAQTKLEQSTEIIVIMGATAPHFESVKKQAENMKITTIVKNNVTNMAELMANADLAIGAAGATTWERCCLGLPTIQIVIAENQRKVALTLVKANAVKLLNQFNELPTLIACSAQWKNAISENASELSDGLGCERVINQLIHGPV
jgi:UDP-2,4-diacetamido-2,4,6-trideoxy-beta-L-altropyranose hydrolase